jgi:hypothetical protein
MRPPAAIETFWNWFLANSEHLGDLYKNRNFAELTSNMNVEIDRINNQLAWEIGAGTAKPYLLTISSEGNPDLRPIADEIIQAAPDLPNWEFYSAKPARTPSAKVTLPERKLEFDTTRWQFVPLERPELGRLDLLVLDDDLAFSERDAALKAVGIYLDQILGEDTVEEWIGHFDVETPHGSQLKTYAMTELPDYLYWVTHREKNPLRHPNG